MSPSLLMPVTWTVCGTSQLLGVNITACRPSLGSVVTAAPPNVICGWKLTITSPPYEAARTARRSLPLRAVVHLAAEHQNGNRSGAVTLLDPPQHLPSLPSVSYAENDVFSAVWFGARAQDRCLYVARF